MRLRPAGPWRTGPGSGARDRVDWIFHSDTLFSAFCAAMAQLGWLEEWLAATALNPSGSSVRFTSLFPWQDNLLYVVPPRTHWPAPASGRLRSAGIGFVPLKVVAALLAGLPINEQIWEADGASGCLLPRSRRPGRPGPFRVALRSAAAVDRASMGTIHPHRLACLEFEPSAGLWFAAEFAGVSAEDAWLPRLRSCVRLLADMGLGGKRSLGWGHFEVVSWQPGTIQGLLADHAASAEPPPDAENYSPEAQPTTEGQGSEPGPSGLLPGGSPEAAATPPEEPPAPASLPERQPSDLTAYWLLSVFNPSPSDAIDWQQGAYSCVTRGGRIESPAGWGIAKRMLRMVAEGSVVLCRGNLDGRAVDVAPEGFPHPVYQAGFAVAVPVPWRVNA